jgi:Protein of unknown function (DUF1761)
MFSSFLSHVNYWAILLAALAYFMLGSLWFSVLFGKIWMKEVEKQGVKISEADKKNIPAKMVQTFLYNVLAAFAIAYIVYVVGVFRWVIGLKLGLLCGIGFAFAGIGIAYTWESRSFKLVMIDCGYAIVGIGLCGAIIAAWH